MFLSLPQTVECRKAIHLHPLVPSHHWFWLLNFINSQWRKVTQRCFKIHFRCMAYSRHPIEQTSKWALTTIFRGINFRCPFSTSYFFFQLSIDICYFISFIFISFFMSFPQCIPCLHRFSSSIIAINRHLHMNAEPVGSGPDFGIRSILFPFVVLL